MHNKKARPTVQDKLSKTSTNVSTSETLDEVHPNLMCIEGVDPEDPSILVWSKSCKTTFDGKIYLREVRCKLEPFLKEISDDNPTKAVMLIKQIIN